jgi:hypothetical protein
MPGILIRAGAVFQPARTECEFKRTNRKNIGANEVLLLTFTGTLGCMEIAWIAKMKV